MSTIFERFLDDDASFGDITSELTIPEDLDAHSEVIAKEDGLVAGLKYLRGKTEKFGLKITLQKKDGEFANKGDVVAFIDGNARKILLIERTFLNILGRMSGIATTTRRIVNKAESVNQNVRIAATRKTFLGQLDKIAVIVGGGDPHRWSLSDHILIKDSHIALVGMEEAIKRVKKTSFIRKIEVEVESVKDAIKAMDLNVDIILLDNFKPEQISKVARLLQRKGLRDKILLEASGGINEKNITEYAKCDVDIISIGALTHSTKNMDFSMETRLKQKEV